LIKNGIFQLNIAPQAKIFYKKGTFSYKNSQIFRKNGQKKFYEHAE